MGIDYSERTGYFITFDRSTVTKNFIRDLQNVLDHDEQFFELEDDQVIAIKEYGQLDVCRYHEVRDDLPLDHTFGFKELTDPKKEFSPSVQSIVKALLDRLPDAKLVYGEYTCLC